LADVFPNLQANLCTWHLNKNITTNCKKFFTTFTQKTASSKKNMPDPWMEFMSSWGQVTKAKTPNIFSERLDSLKVQLASCPSVLEYIKTSILPVKELFVVAWACQHPHLRNLNTSCIESGHAYVKTFIKNSTGDLLSVFKSLSLAIDTQLNQVHESIGRDTVKSLVNVPKCFIPLLGHISTFALKECLLQFNRIKTINPTEPCSGTVTIGLGIPCAHKIVEILEHGDALAPENFHVQWHLKYNPEITVRSFYSK
jgi:hypothetical protein